MSDDRPEDAADDAHESPRARTTEERLADLERRGELVRAKGRWRPPPSGEPIPGALERFLAERGRSWEQ